MHAHEVDVDATLVRRLLAAQMPHLADLPLVLVEPWGTDNAIWRLGEELVVRLPRVDWAQAQVRKEATWLPRLAPLLPIPVPEPVAVGTPALGYPFPWCVHRWLPGEAASRAAMSDPVAFGHDLAGVIRALWEVPTHGAPAARNRARPLADYDEDARAAIEGAAHLIDRDAALRVWESALAARPHPGPTRWVHGDLEGNCLLRDGRLAGLVDWGSSCAGDPAVDVQVVWSPLFDDDARAALVADLGIDADTLARSRGAAIHQACAALPYYQGTYPLIVERSWCKLRTLGVDSAGGAGAT